MASEKDGGGAGGGDVLAIVSFYLFIYLNFQLIKATEITKAKY